MKPDIIELDEEKSSECASCGMPFEYDGLGISRQMRYYLNYKLVAMYSPKGQGEMRCDECGLKEI